MTAFLYLKYQYSNCCTSSPSPLLEICRADAGFYRLLRTPPVSSQKAVLLSELLQEYPKMYAGIAELCRRVHSDGVAHKTGMVLHNHPIQCCASVFNGNEFIIHFQWSKQKEDVKCPVQSLFDRKEQLELIVRGINDGVWDWNLQRGSLWLSQRWKEMLGYGDAELPNSFDTFTDLLHDDDRHDVMAFVDEYLAGKRDHFELRFRMRHKSGHYVWILSRGEAFRNERGIPVRMAGSHRDITKEVESKREMQKLYQAMEQNPRAIMITDPRGTIEYVNPEFTEMTGYSLYEVRGRNPRILKSGKTPNRTFTELWQRISGGKRWAGELCNRRKDGTSYWDKSVISPILDHRGNIISFMDVKEDVTEIRRVYSDLARFRTIFESARFAAGIVDPEDLSILYLNEYSAWVHGYDREEVADKGLELFHTSRQLEELNTAVMTKIYNQGTFTGETWHLHKSGSVFPMLTTATFFDDKLTGRKLVATTSVNISTWKEEQNLRIQREQELREYINKAPMAIFIHDTKGGFLDCNPAAEHILGYSRQELQELKISDITHTDNLEQSMSLFAMVLNNQQARGDVHVYCKDGSSIWGLINSQKIGPDKILSFLQDISTRKETEIALAQAKDAAEEANRAKSEFLANMSHEIRTPLNGVIGFSDLLLNTSLTAKQREYTQIVQSSSHHLMDLINDILDFSKIEAGKLELFYERTDFFALVDELTDMLKYRIHKKGLEFLTDISPRIPGFVRIDSMRLRQILANLLSNAVKFTERGEILFRVYPRGEMRKNEISLRFIVKDSGIGISPEKQKKIFSSFTQADTSTTRRYGGTGLGLSISRRLLEKMGSSLQLTSRKGEGACFYFDLALTAQGPCVVPTPPTEKIERALIVDDNRTNRKILHDMLAYRGVSSLEAAGAREALEILGAVDSLDLLIVDYHMPEMDGLELIRSIHSSMDRPADGPLIFMHSSSDDAFIHQECERLGVRYCMVKPVKMIPFYSMLDTLEGKSTSESGPWDAMTQSRESRSVKSSSMAYTVLVAEDNEINRVLAKTVVSTNFPNSEILEASDGKEAVDLFVQERPDLILMDIQMPRLDGYEAARRIRSIERKENGAHPVPIIALTAGTVKGEEERCRRAGMDDYLSKPVVESRMTEMVYRYLVLDETKKAESDAASPDTAYQVQKKYEHCNIDELSERTAGRDSLLNSIIDMARQQIPALEQAIETALDEADISGLRESAHTLKGTALNLACPLLAEIAEDIQRRAEQEKIHEFEENIRRKLRAETAAVMRVFDEIDTTGGD
ncbi:MAG: PAS domain S-box protein [Fibrobacterota bacterium]